MEHKKEATTMETAITALIVLVVFFLGYYTGKGITDSVVEKQAKRLRGKVDLGAVNKPTARERAKQGTRLEEEEEAMTETLTGLGIKPKDED